MALPNGFEAKYRKLLGSEADAFLASFDQPAENGYRINPLRPTAKLDENGPKIPWSQWGHYGKVDGNGIDHVAGYLYSQEPSAQFVGTVAAPKPGERVLDLCAAPGGKTTHLASYMHNKGLLVANEINAGRARVLASNVERAGLLNTLVINHDPASLAQLLPGFFDRILVDAPCSGEGMFRKDPAAMSFWSEDYPHQCATRQHEILHSAFAMLKPGGTLVYSTCTFAPEEDEQTIAWALAHESVHLEPISKPAGIEDGNPAWADGNNELTKTARLWPHHLAGEGHFVAKLQKEATAPAAKEVRLAESARLSRDQQAIFADFWTHTFTLPTPHNLYVHHNQLTQLPNDAPILKGLRLVAPGVQLGTFKKNRFEPSHSLATAFDPQVFKSVVPVTADEYQRYRHGETLARPALEGKQTVLLTFEEKGFAVGKLVNGTIKNAYPKGLRI